MSGHHLHTGGHITKVLTFAKRVEDIAETLGADSLQFVARYYLATASHLSGDYRRAERIYRQLMQSLHGQPTRERFGLVVSPAVHSRVRSVQGKKV